MVLPSAPFPEAAPAKEATYEDLERLPPGVKGEIIDGVLYTQSRPSAKHQDVGGILYADAFGLYQRGRGGPGGWWILIEPGIRAEGSPEFSPDVAGWRRERLPSLPKSGPVELPPDWLCEVHSPSTRGYDLVTKRNYYARIGVHWVWYVDPEARTLRVLQLQGKDWLEVAAHADDERVRCPPFPEMEVDLAEWWREE